MKNVVVLDLFLGDSGKGKIVDYLASRASNVVRFNGSNNAGHTLKVGNDVFKTHAVPSGILYNHTINFIAHGCAIDPLVLLKEIEQFKHLNDKIVISGQAHIIMPDHIELDIEREKRFAIGSTRRGVSPAFEAKYGRRGLRYIDLFLSYEEFCQKANSNLDLELFYNESIKLREHIISDGVEFIHELTRLPTVFEGAQGTFLDIDIGDYPFVTASNCTIGSVFTGTGLNPKQIDEVVGVIKSYGSYVGTNQSFDDIKDETINDLLCELGQEYGTTTGRRRRLCWLDLDQISKAIKINGPTKLAITRLDTLGQLPFAYIKSQGVLKKFETWGDLSNISSIQDLPSAAKEFLSFIENTLNVPIWAVGIGPERSQLLIKETINAL
jgi:adenylosuccinate synthase